MKILNSILFLILFFCIFAVGISTTNGEGLSFSAPANGFTFTHNLTVGISGDDVSVLQQFLITGGFLKIISPTGYFGLLTKTALGAWQKSAGIYPSVGFFGPISREKINSAARQAPVGVIQGQNVPVTTTAVGTTVAAIATTSTAASSSASGLPVRLKIPKLSVDAGFQYTGLKSDGTMEVPSNIFDIGWFTGSSRPGEKGVSIITGHVAQIRLGVVTKPGVFSSLYELSIGDKLSVLNDKGETINFVVREIRSYDPAADATDVFTSADNGVHLNIITCEGTWNPAQLSYSQRLVVFTDIVR